MACVAGPIGTPSLSGYPLRNAFDKNRTSVYLSQLYVPAEVGYDFGVNTVVTSYNITYSGGDITTRSPNDFTLQGYDGTWNVIDQRYNQNAAMWASSGNERLYSVSRPGNYTQYKLVVTDDNDARSGVVTISIGELTFNTYGGDAVETPLDLPPPSTPGPPSTPMPTDRCSNPGIIRGSFYEGLSGPDCWEIRCGYGHEYVEITLVNFISNMTLCATDAASERTCLEEGSVVTLPIPLVLAAEGEQRQQGRIEVRYSCEGPSTAAPSNGFGEDSGKKAMIVTLSVGVPFVVLMVCCSCCLRKRAEKRQNDDNVTVVIPTEPVAVPAESDKTEMEVRPPMPSAPPASPAPPACGVSGDGFYLPEKRLPAEEIPSELLCSISSQLMVCPVSCVCTPSPHTFDRDAIEASLKRYPWCPVSRRSLRASDLTLNTEIDALLQKFNSRQH